MNAQIIVQRFRAFLLALAAFLCVGTVIELFLANHLQEPLQLVPFVLCAAGLFTIAAVMLQAQIKTIWALRLTMSALMLGSLVGVYEHITSNWEVVTETKPNLAASAMLWEALRGAAPLLAPGILVLVAVLALAATYEHPALGNGTTE